MNALTTAAVRIAEAAPWQCPLCGEDFEDFEDAEHQAAHCCLWHEFDHTTRVRIATRVEAGASWLDAIEEQRK